MKKKTALRVKPDAVILYATVIVRLGTHRLPTRERARLVQRARKLRATLTPYELDQAKRLIGIQL